MKISVIAPVKNEVQFIGYSIMAVLPYVHEIIYTCAGSSDGTDELLAHIKEKYAGDKLKLFYSIEPGEVGDAAGNFDFNPHDMKAYNAAFNYAIGKATGDACWFLHPDMIVTKWSEVPFTDKAMAWYTNVTSFAKDFNTVITKGRCDKWKNIHAKKLGLHYFGGYGSQNEDFYHSAITETTHKHYGTDFSQYPFMVADSGINVNHYCELKPYERRLEKMKLCLNTLGVTDEKAAEEMAEQHPRVTLEPSSERFGKFEFSESNVSVPEVFSKHKEEFEQFKKQEVTV